MLGPSGGCGLGESSSAHAVIELLSARTLCARLEAPDPRQILVQGLMSLLQVSMRVPGHESTRD